MAAIVPISDRRARLALILALLGLPSVGVTLPAAIWFGVSALRQRRLASGGEPAMGFLAVVVSGIDLLFIYQALGRLFGAIPPASAWAALAGGICLSGVVALLAASSLRIHPERAGALLLTRAALIATLGGGAAMFVRLLAVIQG